MPTYEYRCPSCSHDFELFQRMSDEPVAVCPNCGADAVRRLSGGAGLLFKGSGFYITDYRSDSYKKAAGSDPGAGGKGGSKSDGSSGTTGGTKKSGSEGSGSSSSSETKSSTTPKAE